VTDSGLPKPGAARENRRREFRSVALTLLRALASTVALVGIYYLLPLDRTSPAAAIALLAVGLLGLVGLITYQVRSITYATYPALRAVGALATSAPLFLLLFAGTYFVTGEISASNFSESMTRTDALYFTVTVFATVGFGDIVATSEAARVLVMSQMVVDVIIVGLGAKIIVDAIQQGRERQSLAAGDASDQDQS
jgi:voltage-gated potassium channel